MKKKEGLTPLAANSFDSSKRKQVFLSVLFRAIYDTVRRKNHESIHMQRTWWRQRFNMDKLRSSWEQTTGVLEIL